MPEVTHRIADLPDNKRRLLERLLEQKGSAPVKLKDSPSRMGTAPTPGTTEPVSNGNGSGHDFSLNEVKASYKRFYDAVNTQLDASVFGPFSFFLNYGYVPNLSPQHSRIQLPDHFLNKNSVRLVLELIGDYDLKDQRILDVGCGRGGTVFVIKQFFEPRSVQGVDLSPNAIASCRANHHYDNVRFDEGDAEKLPFNREEFDVVTSVESSHSYPNLNAFYAEVFRVLVPGGRFLYTDVIPQEATAGYLAELKRIGFVMELERDITENVLLSCDEVATARVGAYDAGNDPELMNNFLAAPGSQVYQDLRSRRWTYRIYRFRKPAGTENVVNAPPWPTLR